MIEEMKKTIQNSEKYSWGDNCLGWHLVNHPQLSVIQELMPPNSEEVKHKLLHAQQFFFVLKGEAVFEVDGETVLVKETEGKYIEKNQEHQIRNESEHNLEFLVISQPHSHNDKVTI